MKLNPRWSGLARILNRVQRWLSGRPGWMVAVLGLLGLMVLATPQFIGAPVGELYGCATGGGASCTAGRIGIVLLGLLALGLVYIAGFYGLSQLVRVVIWHRMRLVVGREARCHGLVHRFGETDHMWRIHIFRHGF